MIDDMGIFRTTIGIAPLGTPNRVRELVDVMVVTGSEYNWIPAEVLAGPLPVARLEVA